MGHPEARLCGAFLKRGWVGQVAFVMNHPKAQLEGSLAAKVGHPKARFGGAS